MGEGGPAVGVCLYVAENTLVLEVGYLRKG
jgi:hypothetical protein